MNRNQDQKSHHLIRGIILIGFMLLLFKLILTNNISLLIAPKMVHFIYFTLFILLILGVVLVLSGTSKENYRYDCECANHHSYPPTFFKSLFLYSLFIIPITTGFLFSDHVLGSSVVMNRTIKLGAYSQDSISKNTNALSPSNATSSNPSSNDPNADLSAEKPDPISETEYSALEKKLLQEKKMIINDDLYVPMMNIIQDHQSSMIGKTITTKGFVYREKKSMQDQIIVARFGITCCVADASVYGIMAQGNVARLPNDEWIQVTGTIGQTIYDGASIPIIKIKQVKKIPEPKNPYVYDMGVRID
ncbi:TIGR03943 family putative permease subunit [Peribacillus loiseleuriae]|uniref:TIGR03943 family putative permease subunit n=1 Tax=Peribacillus loiseleuriae TaxID=1679170 RepID=UPI003D0356FD